jgi:D-glycero-D-manno-heptose 1,7-bisphosphate phosphatase
MLEEALRRYGANPADTPMIGDNLRDLEAAAEAGCPRHLVRTGHGAKVQADGIPPTLLPVRVHDDLAAAITALLGPESA